MTPLIRKVLKNKSGASLIIVLGIMLLLMAVGVSALVAASADTGFVLKQKEYNRVMIFDSSIHQNILYSLQGGEDEFLSTQLVRAIYKANDSGEGKLGDIEMDVSVGGTDLTGDDIGKIRLEGITLSFPDQEVSIRQPIPAIYSTTYDDEGEPAGKVCVAYREPKVASVNASMIITVIIKANDRFITSRAFYSYTNGELSDDPDGEHQEVATTEVFDMIFTDYGKWELIKYEKADSQN